MAMLLAPNAIMTETKLLGGEITLDGSNPTPIITGLRTSGLRARASPAGGQPVVPYRGRTKIPGEGARPGSP
jgi:hypothetical protein